MRIRIAQCLCGPQRHCIMALALRESLDHLSEQEALTMLESAVSLTTAGRGAEIGVANANPWCGICGRPKNVWLYEIGWSREFANWETAERFLRAAEADQRATYAILSLLDATYDARFKGGSVN